MVVLFMIKTKIIPTILNKYYLFIVVKLYYTNTYNITCIVMYIYIEKTVVKLLFTGTTRYAVRAPTVSSVFIVIFIFCGPENSQIGQVRSYTQTQ